MRAVLFIALIVLIIALLLAARNDAAASTAYDREQNRARHAICAVFGRYCSQALRVAWCESRYRTWAYNPRGGYAGLFQVSPHWRYTVPGYGPGAWAQSRHAYKVFRLTGSNWSHWQCRP